MIFKRTAVALSLAVLLIAGASILYLYSASARNVENPPTETLDALGFTMLDLGKFTVVEHFGGYFPDDREQNLSAERGGDIVRIKIFSNEAKDQAQKFASGQFLLLESQYDSRLPPYPEFLTNQTGCEDRFLPERRAHARGAFYLVHADERFNYGLCAEDLVRYKAGFGIFYCELEQRLFQIEYFTGKDRPFNAVEGFMNSFRCSAT